MAVTIHVWEETILPVLVRVLNVRSAIPMPVIRAMQTTVVMNAVQKTEVASVPGIITAHSNVVLNQETTIVLRKWNAVPAHHNNRLKDDLSEEVIMAEVTGMVGKDFRKEKGKSKN